MRTQIGKRVSIHSGTVVGSDGFGYVFHQGSHQKIPQVGNVVVHDDVEIGPRILARIAKKTGLTPNDL